MIHSQQQQEDVSNRIRHAKSIYHHQQDQRSIVMAHSILLLLLMIPVVIMRLEYPISVNAFSLLQQQQLRSRPYYHRRSNDDKTTKLQYNTDDASSVSSSLVLACCSNGNTCENHHHHEETKRSQTPTPIKTMIQIMTIRHIVQRSILSIWKRINDTTTTTTATTAVDGKSQDRVVMTSGIGSSISTLFGSIKKVHNPIVYFIFGILCGFRYDWCFKSPIYWFAIGFTIKWYRARYVYKIPVWDRQPNWNNVITSREQEKDLKAYTCKNCGSTLFIAKTREFFFEGNTGFGGLGCFTCGAKGKDNFIMDRDRIVEDVGDMDDYFEYERPLDFVSRAERRKLLKEAEGDVDKANQLLLERTTGMSSSTSNTSSTSVSSKSNTVDSIDAVIEENDDSTIDSLPSQEILSQEPHVMDGTENDATETAMNQITVSHDDLSLSEMKINGDTLATTDDTEVAVAASSTIPSATSSISDSNNNDKNKTTSSTTTASPKKNVGLDGLDELDMDAW